LAEGHFDTLNTSIGRLNLNSDKERINTSTPEKSISKESPNLILHRKVDHAKNDLHEDYYPNEVDHVVKRLQFNVLISGSPRVGKSQLINALCGDKKLAKTSPSLNSCTTEVECYTLEDDQQQTPGINPFRINFYDTPGIESWTEQNGRETILKFIRDQDPVCLIYCASPGSFADLNQLHSVLEFCKNRQIFCALVCTNMWSNPNRTVVFQQFEKELAFFGARVKKPFKQQHDQSIHEVIHFGDGALCTMVNSKEYYDPEFSPVRKPIQGIDELIHSIMEQLDNEKLIGWCHAVLYRRSFWEKIKQKTAGFVSARMKDVANWSNTKNAAHFSQFLH
jgi:GTP-binding protein EngB required for normal cell division